MQRLFPNTESNTISDVLERIQNNSATIGIAAFVGSIWIGASFWGAMDTAFCRIYHVPCRGWVEQKRFSFAMLGVVLLFIAASIFVPTLESTLVSSTDNLPFGLSGVQVIDKILLLGAALLITFVICSVIFWAVPKAPVPWRSIWPGALFVTFGAGLANWLFPLYLTNVSTLSKFGSTLGFVLIALLWFYLLSLAIMAGRGDQLAALRVLGDRRNPLRGRRRADSQPLRRADRRGAGPRGGLCTWARGLR